MSHPHDGWDSEMKIDYGPRGAYFAWAGDESNSMMSYVDLNWDFSQFDRDNFNRFDAAGYIVNANAIAGDVLASANASLGLAELDAADVEVGLAKEVSPFTITPPCLRTPLRRHSSTDPTRNPRGHGRRDHGDRRDRLFGSGGG